MGIARACATDCGPDFAGGHELGSEPVENRVPRNGEYRFLNAIRSDVGDSRVDRTDIRGVESGYRAAVRSTERKRSAARVRECAPFRGDSLGKEPAAGNPLGVSQYRDIGIVRCPMDCRRTGIP